MPKIHLCFLWHMHQPFYKDLVTGEYRLPWTRMHALKDYYGMVKILEEFPGVRQTFNLVPSMVVQVEEYASGTAKDPFLALALKAAEDLTRDERTFILRNFFMANPDRLIRRYPRYSELHSAYQASAPAADSVFGVREMRDLQVLSQLAWFDEEFLEHDPEVRDLVRKERGYSRDDQALMGRKQREIVSQVIPQYRKLAASRQIEISTTPFYHPILPLICDSDIAAVSHPRVPLPPRFRYPGDARLQLQRAYDYIAATFGVAPRGLWPSEGSVSDEALSIASEVGFEWAAADNGVLARSLGREATPEVTYKPYLWHSGAHKMKMVFRDHLLSDLIGFVYSGMDAGHAAADFLQRIDDNCAPILASGHDALAPIILDGENAWEYYDRGGRPFFRELYGRIQAHPRMHAVTLSEAFKTMPADKLSGVVPGSWINANFDIWLGAEEDNLAWRYLLEARQAYDAAKNVPEPRRDLALEELLIAEGSDWNWWYGPEHGSDNRTEFDELYRQHLANVYSALGLAAPRELSQPILKDQAGESMRPPLGPVSPAIDGVVGSYFEWMAAGVCEVDRRSGAMHGRGDPVKEVRFGSDAKSAYVRVDFAWPPEQVEGLEIQIHASDGATRLGLVKIGGGAAAMAEGPGRAAYRDVLEMSLPRADAARGVRLSFWQGGLPLGSLPRRGAFEPERVAAGAWD